MYNTFWGHKKFFFFNMASFYGLYSHYTFTCFTMEPASLYEYNLLYFSHHVNPLIGDYHLIILSKTNRTVSRSLSWNACRSRHLLSPLPPFRRNPLTLSHTILLATFSRDFSSSLSGKRFCRDWDANLRPLAS